ncbi:hypothetical protein FIU87_05565 [Bacillus sp. THAF10]|nr:hypothetical protein FIU87_05565 [Bacillus sp. THAF10]
METSGLRFLLWLSSLLFYGDNRTSVFPLVVFIASLWRQPDYGFSFGCLHCLSMKTTGLRFYHRLSSLPLYGDNRTSVLPLVVFIAALWRQPDFGFTCSCLHCRSMETTGLRFSLRLSSLKLYGDNRNSVFPLVVFIASL